MKFAHDARTISPTASGARIGVRVTSAAQAGGGEARIVHVGATWFATQTASLACCRETAGARIETLEPASTYLPITACVQRSETRLSFAGEMLHGGRRTTGALVRGAVARNGGRVTEHVTGDSFVLPSGAAEGEDLVLKGGIKVLGGSG
jgi:hypothetical protein